MDPFRRARAEEWLARLGTWTGPLATDRRIGIACEIVRGIIDIDDPDWDLAVEWAGGQQPVISEWIAALEFYGPVLTGDERIYRAGIIVAAVDLRDKFTVRAAVR